MKRKAILRRICGVGNMQIHANILSATPVISRLASFSLLSIHINIANLRSNAIATFVLPIKYNVPTGTNGSRSI